MNTTNDTLGLAAMATSFHDGGAHEEAAVLFVEAAAHDPRYLPAAALSWQLAGDLARACALYDRIGIVDDVQIMANAAEAYVDAAMPERALAAIEAAVRLDPTGAHPASVRARLLALKAARDLG